MIKPRRLKKGDTIGIIAPSSPLIHKTVEKSIKQLEVWGYSVKVGESCFNKYGYLAGQDTLRGKDLNNFFADPEISAIIALRGGYGSARILPLIDFRLIKENPKIFVGFSDITALHIAIRKFCQLVTFHGPMAGQIGEGLDEFTKESLLTTLTMVAPVGEICNPYGEKLQPLVAGEAEGEIVGGNLTVIASTLGTPYEIETKDKILFIEEVGEEPYRIDRLLTQLYLSGKIADAAGIIIGDFKQCEAKNPQESFNLIEVLKERISPLGIPTIVGLKAGHCFPQVTLPFGIKTYINPTRGIIRIKESGVI